MGIVWGVNSVRCRCMDCWMVAESSKETKNHSMYVIQRFIFWTWSIRRAKGDPKNEIIQMLETVEVTSTFKW
jgi:hypothetical protein